ncbi:hypothetical protein BDZ89DRAFT_1226434 [Hymenopellis radicata]|nr:hypothetical protein BDZ89DRAFT_1226434 [Hymenopellis radicata]
MDTLSAGCTPPATLHSVLEERGRRILGATSSAGDVAGWYYHSARLSPPTRRHIHDPIPPPSPHLRTTNAASCTTAAPLAIAGDAMSSAVSLASQLVRGSGASTIDPHADEDVPYQPDHDLGTIPNGVKVKNILQRAYSFMSSAVHTRASAPPQASTSSDQPSTAPREPYNRRRNLRTREKRNIRTTPSLSSPAESSTAKCVTQTHVRSAMKNTICIDEYDLETAPITTPETSTSHRVTESSGDSTRFGHVGVRTRVTRESRTHESERESEYWVSDRESSHNDSQIL